VRTKSALVLEFLFLALFGCSQDFEFPECSDEVTIRQEAEPFSLATMKECGNRLTIESHADVRLSDLVSLEAFGLLRPKIVQDGSWKNTVDPPVPVAYTGGLLWSWKEEGYERQIVGRINQESGKWYYLLRLELYTQPAEAVLSPEVRRHLPEKQFFSIDLYGGDGYSASLERASDGIFLYWYWLGNSASE
jgi:hypothetical protein